MRPWIIIPLCIAALMTAMPAHADRIPSSARSREVIARVRPLLEKSLNAKGFQWGAPVFIRILKAGKCLEIWLWDGQTFRRFKCFKICTYGRADMGPKTTRGDGCAPEGFYYVRPQQLNPFSQFHLAFNLGYPNAYDRLYGRTGSALMVHGACVSVGCFAMTDGYMEEIYALVDAALRKGQPFFRVHIFPFSMSANSMAEHCRAGPNHTNAAGCPWQPFWENLKEGYDYFEHHRRPPNVRVFKGRYVFGVDNS